MYNTLIVVAEKSRAKIYAMESRKEPLHEMIDLYDAAQRLPVRENVSDHQGRTFDSHSLNRHAKEPKMSVKQVEANDFAKMICEYIEERRRQNTVRKLILISSPEFLGLLRHHLSKAAQDLVEIEIDKNLVKLEEADIRHYLSEHAYH